MGFVGYFLLKNSFIVVEVGEILVFIGFGVSTLLDIYSIGIFTFEVEMQMIERNVGMVKDGFGTTIDFSLARKFDWNDTKVEYDFFHYI